LLTVLPFALGAFECFVNIYGTEESVFTSQLDEYTSEVMYATGISRNSTDKFVFEDLTFPKKALAVNVFLGSSFMGFVIYYADMFNLLAALAVHDITSRYERFLSSQNNISIRSLLTYYEQMCTKINKINAISSQVKLIVYAGLVIWISTSSLEVIENSNWVGSLMILIIYILHAFAFLLAANANKTVKLQKKTIF